MSQTKDFLESQGYQLAQFRVVDTSDRSVGACRKSIAGPLRNVESEEKLDLILQGLDSNIFSNGQYGYAISGKKEIGTFLNAMGITQPHELIGRNVEAYVRVVNSRSYRPSGIELATIIPLSR